MNSVLTGGALLIFQLLCYPALSASYYVTTTGNDGNTGTTLGNAFATWQRGITAAAAGDTILISPGTYNATGLNGPLVSAKSGSSGSPITMQGNGGRPILDCSALTDNTGIFCFRIINSNWWVLRDLELREAPEVAPANWTIGLEMVNVNNLLIERVSSHDHSGSGVWLSGNSANNTMRHVDSYNNYDTSTGGGNADGFAMGNMPQGYNGNQVIACRAWSNGDDGFDLWEGESPVTITESWSFRNGYIPGTQTAAGDGNGFKLGRNDNTPAHVITKNLTFSNRASGMDNNAGAGSPTISANTAYANGTSNFIFNNGSGMAHILTNNLSYGATTGAFGAGVTQTNNSWQLGLTLTDDDFSSVDSTGVDGTRQSDGSLPHLPFMRPVSCDIINRSPTNLACCGKTLGALGRYVDPPDQYRRSLPPAAALGVPLVK